VLLENCYPRPFLDKLIRTERRRFFDFLGPVQNPVVNSNVISKFISVLYIHGLFYKIKDFLIKFGLSVVGKSCI
jgi:hypothetical protein